MAYTGILYSVINTDGGDRL